MTVEQSFFPPIRQPNRPATFVILALGGAMVFALVSAMSARGSPEAAIRGLSAQCDSRDCVSPRQLVTLSEADLMKRRLGSHALVVDIRSEGEVTPGLSMGADVLAPFLDRSGVPGMDFRIDFADKVDDALRAARMGHDEPVILVSPSVERSVLAALLLQERGYSGILVLRTRMRVPTDNAAPGVPVATGAARTPPA
jgi:rhodanese-related sulfurtransferase